MQEYNDELEPNVYKIFTKQENSQQVLVFKDLNHTVFMVRATEDFNPKILESILIYMQFEL